MDERELSDNIVHNSRVVKKEEDVEFDCMYVENVGSLNFRYIFIINENMYYIKNV